jgi:hypothetical protein
VRKVEESFQGLPVFIYKLFQILFRKFPKNVGGFLPTRDNKLCCGWWY